LPWKEQTGCADSLKMAIESSGITTGLQPVLHDSDPLLPHRSELVS